MLGKKVRHWNCEDKYILIALNELIGFGYDLIDSIIPKMVLEKWDLYFVVNICSL